MDRLYQLLPFTVPIGLMVIFSAVLTILLSFFFLSLPLRLLIRYSKNYKLSMRCRQLSDWLLFIIILLVVILSLSSTIQSSTVMAGDDAYWAAVITINVAFLTIIPFYIIVNYLVGRVDFYNEAHVKQMDYFILYLRSFKDDNKNGKKERKLLHSLNRLYSTFAIGRPDEFMPARGAKRIYVGDNWQHVVLELMHKAPLILMRVNTSENFLWEFDQCVRGGYLNKALFWVSDVQGYTAFQNLAREKYGLDFPSMGETLDHDVFFYALPDGGYYLYQFTDKSSYHRFANVYLKQHQDHVLQNHPYFYGRNMLLPLSLSPVYSKRIIPGINRWSWAGFFFPDFFIILHSVKWRIWLYLIYLSVTPLYFFVLQDKTLSAIIVNILYLAFSLLIARNGRTVAWLSRKWESVSYFESECRKANYLTVGLGILRIIFWLSVAFFTAINPWGWNISNAFEKFL